MWRRLQQWLKRILNWVKGRFKQPEPLPPPPAIQPLSDAGYERLLMQVLDRVAAGEGERQVLENLGERRNDKFFQSWLRRFGKKLIESPMPNREVARRIVRIGEIDCGEICQIAGQYGRQQLSRDYPPLTESEYETLFHQLLQQVGHGETAIVKFLEDVETRATGEQWAQWLRGYGDRLLSEESPNYQLAAPLIILEEQMQQLPSFVHFGEIAGNIGRQLREREEKEEIWEYDGADIYSPVESDKGG